MKNVNVNQNIFFQRQIFNLFIYSQVSKEINILFLTIKENFFLLHVHVSKESYYYYYYRYLPPLFSTKVKK